MARGWWGANPCESPQPDEVSKILASTRRPLTPHPKLVNPSSPNLETLLPEVAAWGTSAVICALGTTRKKAGSNEGLRYVDYDLPLQFARAARNANASSFAVVTSIGASPTSPLHYARTKGELERDLRTLGFRSLTLVRPMFMEGERAERRRGEAAVVALAEAFGSLLPRSLRVSRASTVAPALVEAVLHPRDGVRVISSGELASAS